MSEYRVKLNGWQAVAGIVVLIVIVVLRLVTFSDKTGDTKLMREIEAQLRTKAAASLTGARLNIESIQASSPLFEFSTSRDIVVKVIYTLKDSSGTGDRKTSYFLFHHGSIGNVWTYKYQASNLSYYLNFL